MESDHTELFLILWTIFFFVAMISLVFGGMCRDAVKRDAERSSKH